MTAVLRSAPESPHVGRIEFGRTHRKKGGWSGTATVAYDGEEWGVELDMIDVYTSNMVAFFDELARERNGWCGAKCWESEFQEMSLEASHLGNGLVALAFRLWWSQGDELDNDRKGELRVRAADLPGFAARMRELTGVRDPERFRKIG